MSLIRDYCSLLLPSCVLSSKLIAREIGKWSLGDQEGKEIGCSEPATICK